MTDQTTAAPARLDLRLDSRDNDRIAKAAARRGMAVSACVLGPALRRLTTRRFAAMPWNMRACSSC